jgi:hypothetical protein
LEAMCCSMWCNVDMHLLSAPCMSVYSYFTGLPCHCVFLYKAPLSHEFSTPLLHG